MKDTGIVTALLISVVMMLAAGPLKPYNAFAKRI